MKNKLIKRVLAFALATSLTVLPLTGCGKEGDKNATPSPTEISNGEVPKTSGDDDTLRFALSVDFNKVDTLIAYNDEINIVVNSVSEGLFYYDENSKVQPLLAESYTQPDETTYIYQIRDDVTFSDGSKLTAEDVEFSLNRHRDESNASLLGWMFDNVDTIEQTGDYEVTVKLKTPDPTWQYTLATTASNVISKAYYEQHSDDFGTSSGGFLGSGPYVITSWDASEINLEYNENYWNKDNTDVGFKELRFLSVQDQSVVKSLIESGQVDITRNVSLESAKELSSNSELDIKKIDRLVDTFLSFNTTVKPLDDVKVRHAIDYAIDKEAILKDVIGEEYASIGKSQLFSEKIGEANADLWKDFFDNQESYAYDIDKAKELLKEAGYEDGLSLRLTYTANNSNEENVALLIQQNLADIGIDVTLEGVDNATVSTLRYGGPETRDYELLITRWGADYPDPVGTVVPMAYSTNNVAGGSNWAEYKNADFDKYIDLSYATTGEERIGYLQDALTVLGEDIPYAPLYNPYYVFITSKRVDYEFSTMLLYNIYTKDIKKAK